MRKAIILLLAAGLLAGCGVRERIQGANNRVAFDGIYFRTRLNAEKDDKQAFAVTVAGAARNLDAAREAGRYEATRYCVTNYGNSEVDWTQGPEDAAENLVIENGALVLTGRCRG
ncbi:MAG: hypothetical protein R3256_12390 [Thalassovita sp.]|nr:hypothetical protein [Thalassovita sp.]